METEIETVDVTGGKRLLSPQAVRFGLGSPGAALADIWEGIYLTYINVRHQLSKHAICQLFATTSASQMCSTLRGSSLISLHLHA